MAKFPDESYHLPNRESQPWGEKALVSETSVPSPASWGGECYVKLLGSPTCQWSWERWNCCAGAPTMQQKSCCWLIAALNCTARQPQPWLETPLHGNRKHWLFPMPNADNNCCQSNTEDSGEDKHDCYGWFIHAEWEMWLTFAHYAKNCWVQSVSQPPSCSQSRLKLLAQLMINEQLSN